MNLFFRMWMIIFAARRGKVQSLLQSRRDHFRVWLHDLGWRDHLPNYRVFSFMELGRFGIWHQSRLALSGRYSLRMIAAQDFVYLKPLRPFQAFTMTTDILSWDEKYIYYQHQFFCDNNLVALGLVKEIAIKSGKTVAPALLIDADRANNVTTKGGKRKLSSAANKITADMHPIVEQWL